MERFCINCKCKLIQRKVNFCSAQCRIKEFISRFDDNTQCFIWDGAHHSGKSPLLTENRKKLSAREVLYNMLIGEIEDKHIIINICPNKKCLNIKHLKKISMKENAITNGRRFKLTPSLVEEVFMYRNKHNWTLQDIAIKFNCSKQSIFSIINGETWKFLKLTPPQKPINIIDNDESFELAMKELDNELK